MLNMKKLLTFTLFIFSFTILAAESVRPWIGIKIETHKEGVIIQGTFPGTPGAKAGLKEGDIVQAIDDKKVTNPQELIDTVATKGVGNDVIVHYLSQGKKKQVKLQLIAMPGLAEVAKKSLEGNKAPAFEAKILSGGDLKTLNLHKMPKKPIVLEFWATWCPACMSAKPLVKKLSDENPNVQVISISDEDPIRIKKYIKKARQKGLISKGTIFIQGDQDGIQEKYYVPALPMYIVIDSNKVVNHLTIGAGRNVVDVFKRAKALSN
jgi:thiol-disulfide isomerase/thioredoxin